MAMQRKISGAAISTEHLVSLLDDAAEYEKMSLRDLAVVFVQTAVALSACEVLHLVLAYP